MTERRVPTCCFVKLAVLCDPDPRQAGLLPATLTEDPPCPWAVSPLLSASCCSENSAGTWPPLDRSLLRKALQMKGVTDTTPEGGCRGPPHVALLKAAWREGGL